MSARARTVGPSLLAPAAAGVGLPMTATTPGDALSARLREALEVWRTQSPALSPTPVLTFRAYSSAYERLQKVALRAGMPRCFQ